MSDQKNNPNTSLISLLPLSFNLVLTISGFKKGVFKNAGVSIICASTRFCGPSSLTAITTGLGVLSEVNYVALGRCGAALIVSLSYSGLLGGLLKDRCFSFAIRTVFPDYAWTLVRASFLLMS